MARPHSAVRELSACGALRKRPTRIAEVLRLDAQRQVETRSGDVFDPAELTLPEHVLAVRSAPHQRVFSQASCVVSHGGHGTVMKSLASGVPLLCLPLGRGQGDNAARVVAGGSGLRRKPSSSVKTLRRAVARLIDEPEFGRAARRSASEIAVEGGRRRRALGG